MTKLFIEKSIWKAESFYMQLHFIWLVIFVRDLFFFFASQEPFVKANFVLTCKAGYEATFLDHHTGTRS